MAQDTLVVKLSLRTSDFRFETTDGYDVIRTDDSRFTYTSEPGRPMLPVFVPTYIIPYWKTVKYVEVVSVDSVQVPGYWRIYTAQDQTDTSWVPPDAGPVSLKVYDISGREAKLLLSGEARPGWYEELWNPTRPGVYVIVLRTGKKTLSNKVIFPGGE